MLSASLNKTYPPLTTHVRGERSHDVRRYHPRHRGRRVRDSEQSPRVGRGHVAVVDEVAAEVKAAQTHGSREHRHRRQLLVAVHETGAYEKSSRTNGS